MPNWIITLFHEIHVDSTLQEMCTEPTVGRPSARSGVVNAVFGWAVLSA